MGQVILPQLHLSWTVHRGDCHPACVACSHSYPQCSDAWEKLNMKYLWVAKQIDLSAQQHPSLMTHRNIWTNMASLYYVSNTVTYFFSCSLLPSCHRFQTLNYVWGIKVVFFLESGSSFLKSSQLQINKNEEYWVYGHLTLCSLVIPHDTKNIDQHGFR